MILKADKPQILLGGGAGFVSKTLVYPAMGYNKGLDMVSNILNRAFKDHKHFKDKQQGVSPHIVKCTYYKGQTLQMGLCEFNIEVC